MEEAVAVVTWMEDGAAVVEEVVEEDVEVLIRVDEEEAVGHLINKVESFIGADPVRKTLHKNS
jgi:hypothetical protein